MSDHIGRDPYEQEETSVPPSAERIWRDIFQKESMPDSSQPVVSKINYELLKLISKDEVESVLLKKGKESPGVDGYSWKDLKKVEIELCCWPSTCGC